MAYVLTQGFDYEGEAVLGVYSTLERAQTAASDYASQFSARDYLSIYELELDAAASGDILGRLPVWQVTVDR